MFTEEVTDEADGSAGGSLDAGAAGAAGAGVGEAVSLAEAVALVERAEAALAAVGVHGEGDRQVLDAVVGLAGVAERLAGQRLRLLEEVDRRGAFEQDGAVTTASWYRGRTRADGAAAGREVKAAVRLRHLPALRAALRAGEVSLAHVTAVTDAAVPLRREAIVGVEDTLVELARRARPREVRRAVAAVREQVDADGADDPPPASEGDGPDERRYLSLQPTVDGLLDVRGMLDPLAGEALVALVDSLEAPDPPETPADGRRSAGQRRADALDEGVRLALASREAPVAGGVQSHVLATVDVLELLGLNRAGCQAAGCQPAAGAAGEAGARAAAVEAAVRGGQAAGTTLGEAGEAAGGQVALGEAGEAGGAVGGAGGVAGGEAGVAGGRAGRAPRLRYTGETTAAVMRRLAYEAKITAVLTMGPWRVVSVGRTMRTLPAWLRMVLDMVHGHCRGPDCDRPAAWAEAHHEIPWAEGGETDLNATVPLCVAHHGLVTAGKWHVSLDADTGVCTWTGPAGQVVHTHPP